MKKNFLLALLILFLVNVFFFRLFYLRGQLPFPGDLLLAEYNPWRQYSFFGFAPGAAPHKAQSFDTLCQLYPWRWLAISQLKQGQFPLWNPYNFSGAPLLANFQSAVFYPLNFIYWLTDFKLAWGIQVILQLLLASFFFYLFARRLKISFFGSLLGAIAFGYSSFMTVWLEYNTVGQVILWLPLVLLAIELLLEKVSFWRVSLLIGSLTFSLLAGHFQDFAVVWLFSLIYYLLRQRRLFWLWLLPLLLGAVQLLPGLELIFHSARSPLTKDFLMKKVLLQPYQLIVALAPDYFGNPATRNYFIDDTYIGKVLYIGLLPLLLALIAILRKKDWYLKFFLVSAGAALFLAVSTPVTGLLYSLPFFSSLSPTRILFVFQFALAVLACFGFDFWQKGKIKRWLPVLFAGSLIFLIAWLFALGKFESVTQRNLLYSSALFAAATGLLLFKKIRLAGWLLPWLMIVFVVLDLGRFFQKITPFSPSEFVFPETEIFDFLQQRSGRFWGYGTAAISANYNAVFQLSSPDGYDPLYPRWYGELIRLSEEGNFKPAIRSNANIAPGFGKENFFQNQTRQKILQILSVRYILDRDENQTDETTFPPEDYPVVYQKDGWRIYENQKAADRVFLAKKAYYADNQTEFEEIFNSPDFNPANQVILTGENKDQEFAGGEVEIISEAPSRIKLQTNSKDQGLLVLTDTDYPGWRAVVRPLANYGSAQQAKIYRVNHALRAVEVPPGEHEIEFIYSPLSFRLGLWLSGLSLAGWLLASGLDIMRKR